MTNSPPPSMPPAPPAIGRKARRPVAITFANSSQSAPVVSSLPPSPPPKRSSFYHAHRALLSPRVLGAIAIVSGWAWAGAQYIAGSARNSDLQTAVQRINLLTAELEQVKLNTQAALTGAQQCVAQQGAQALTMRALVGQIARQRGRSDHQKSNEQAAAESRYSTAIAEGRPPYEAARVALHE